MSEREFCKTSGVRRDGHDTGLLGVNLETQAETGVMDSRLRANYSTRLKIIKCCIAFD